MDVVQCPYCVAPFAAFQCVATWASGNGFEIVSVTDSEKAPLRAGDIVDNADEFVRRCNLNTMLVYFAASGQNFSSFKLGFFFQQVVGDVTKSARPKRAAGRAHRLVSDLHRRGSMDRPCSSAALLGAGAVLADPAKLLYDFTLQLSNVHVSEYNHSGEVCAPDRLVLVGKFSIEGEAWLALIASAKK